MSGNVQFTPVQGSPAARAGHRVFALRCLTVAKRLTGSESSDDTISSKYVSDLLQTLEHLDPMCAEDCKAMVEATQRTKLATALLTVAAMLEPTGFQSAMHLGSIADPSEAQGGFLAWAAEFGE